MMMYAVFIMSVIFVISLVGVSSKPSPIYGGLGLIVGGAVGCGIVFSFGGSFLGLMVFLIYLGGMLVVFGYTTAMATEQYPEVWVSNKVVLGGFLLGLVVESLVVFCVLGGEKVSFVFEFNGLGDWVIYDTGDSGFFSEEAMGIAALYSYGTWLVIVTGWSLFIGVVVIMEITRGN
ncbi:NADH dehydrogenase subunit 6 (mitochondrion) [Neophocaena asiaeorientalis]|uniref:NADH-ubiquinone oxidoreductase chain 6 n=4 Tax=Neophocaena TaxID=34891 RepID=A0A0N7BXH8_NEOAA|nr:NADH dehydrogenase subunit 6 [Neophocaena phocaenoides]YP_009121457.1 NADH dehydrogenase subunit 6 [Neophocaena asiaeorientalis]AKH61385.1 NADH dehydrogenase subunit 6 [Neophocaena asiaeorientalis sunameri]AKH61398.1 NADH dehydrogenase subunit 6 [Neophocaena asiaeorientalis asiaeorientalis]AGM48322.1 NADH dehydrogenase subunit 6 [Neophocaena phocaenoides]AJF41830.1 NADH dehydrogenase subunit 6 [Neophocaena asiaeorientalis]ANG08409.1 NADH dehydrogenase subunit 6 [Neophocaena asiaeorientalis